jgi:hypothetical protein
MSFQNKLFKYESKLNNLQKGGGDDLSDAIENNNLDEVRRLLAINPDRVSIVVPNSRGMTPIFFAKSVEMLQLLINTKPDINIIDTQIVSDSGFPRGRTPLFYFSLKSYYKLVLFLLNNGADFNINVGNNFYLFDAMHTIMEYENYNEPDVLAIYKFLLNKDILFRPDIVNSYLPIPDTSYSDNVPLRLRLNTLKKNNMVLPFLATHPEAFNVDYVRYGHPTVKYSEYIREAYNITFDELRLAAAEIARERRIGLESTFLRAMMVRHAAASAPPTESASAAPTAAALPTESASAAPANAGTGTGP